MENYLILAAIVLLQALVLRMMIRPAPDPALVPVREVVTYLNDE